MVAVQSTRLKIFGIEWQRCQTWGKETQAQAALQSRQQQRYLQNMWFRTWWVPFPCNWSNFSCICSPRQSMRAIDFRITKCVCQSHAEMISLLCPFCKSLFVPSHPQSLKHTYLSSPSPILSYRIGEGHDSANTSAAFSRHVFVCNANMSGKKQTSCQQPSMNRHTCAKSSSGERFDSVVFFLCSPDHSCIQHEATHP
jgi:hypothetical protein